MAGRPVSFAGSPDERQQAGSSRGTRTELRSPWPHVRLAETDRLETFSDSVLSITITLLVAEIVQPEHAPGQLLDKLTAQWASYIAFLASFCYAGVIWLNIGRRAPRRAERARHRSKCVLRTDRGSRGRAARLVADSLLLDLMSAVKSGRERARLERDLAERRAELSEMKSPEAAALRAEIEQALAKPAGNELELVRRADFLIEAEARSLAAEERRRAVLEGLASLGYEVSEGMATAWVTGGRVVLRKAANPGYGVELSGGSQPESADIAEANETDVHRLILSAAAPGRRSLGRGG